METIDDVRREAGNPRHGEVGGPPRSVHKFFGPTSLMKLAAFVLFAAGAVVTCIGVFSLVFPIAMVGFCVLAASGLLYARSRSSTV